MKKSLFASIILFTIACTNQNEKSVFPELTGDYIGQALPSDSAVLFAPRIISTGMYERDFAITPDGNEIYYSLFLGD